jgi:hypothetical protein
MSAARAVALGILLAGVTTAHAQMYKCVDERGVTHYSDKPRPGCNGGKVHIQAIPPVSGQTTPRASDLAGQDADFKRRQIERENAAARDKAMAKKIVSAFEKARAAGKERAKVDGALIEVPIYAAAKRLLSNA